MRWTGEHVSGPKMSREIVYAPLKKGLQKRIRQKEIQIITVIILDYFLGIVDKIYTQTLWVPTGGRPV